jgi:hypothetical protein
VGVLGTAGGTLSVCLAVAVIRFLASPSELLSRQAVQHWVLFACVPSAVVFAVSRLGVLQARPWRLLIVGPLSFVVAATAVMVTYNNTLFASGRSR